MRKNDPPLTEVAIAHIRSRVSCTEISGFLVKMYSHKVLLCLFVLSGAVLEPVTADIHWNLTISTLDEETSSVGDNFFDVDTAAQNPDPTNSLDVLQMTDIWGYKIGLKIHLIWLPIIIPFGWIGNIASIAVFVSPMNRRISSCIYMCGLAVTDCGMLILACNYYIKSFVLLEIKKIDMNTYNANDVECKITTWLFQFLSLTGVGIIQCMTVDRLIAVTYPLHALRVCTTSRAKKVLIFLPILSSIYALPYFFLTKTVGASCVSLIIQTPITRIYSWLTLCFSSFVPFATLITMNCIIIASITCKDSSSLGKESSTNNKSLSKSRERQLIIMLLLVSFTFLFMTSPLFIRHILYQYIDRNRNLDTLSFFYVFFHVTNKIYYSNHSVNIILYCVGGAKFRQDLKSLFKCSASRKKQSMKLSVKSDSAPSNSSELMTASCHGPRL